MAHPLGHGVLQPLLCVDVETFMRPASAQGPTCHLVARGLLLLCFLHNVSGTKVHPVKVICWVRGLALRLHY